MDRELDRASPRLAWLTDPKVAEALVAALRRGQDDLQQYRLHAFVVMPNHVHILIEPNVEVVRLLKSLKGASARRQPHSAPSRSAPLAGRVLRPLAT